MTRAWRCSLVALALTAALFATTRAHATFSIAAVDLATGESGVAAASCIAPAEVSIVYGPVPDHGLLVVQSFLHQGTLARGVTGLAAGDLPDVVMDRLLDPSFDPDAAMRQIAILDLAGNVAIFTGPRALAFASHRVHASGDLRFTVQGNRLTGAPVLDRMVGAFVGSGCDLVARLRDALLAAPAPGEGDALCVDEGIPADSAFLGASLAQGATVSLEATEKGVDPMPRIRAAYDAFRLTTPCPAPTAPPDPSPLPDDDSPSAPDACALALAGPPAHDGVALWTLFLGIAGVARRSRARTRLRTVPGSGA